MKRTLVLLGTAALASTVAACDGLKEAFTAHADMVAKAQGQQLSTERLATLIGNSQIPVRKDIAATVGDFWVSYQLLGYAGAHGDATDSTKNWWVSDTKAIDEAMWSAIIGSRTKMLFEKVSKTFASDTTNLEQKYNQAEALAAQHILVMLPQNGQGMTQAKQDEVRKKAEGIRAKVTAENFGALAKQYSEDPGSKDNNGTYVFPKGQMVPEFENAVVAAKPGEIAPGLIKTSYGYHIIRRHTLAEVRQQFVDQLMKDGGRKAQTDYVANLRKEWKVEFKPDAVKKAKEVAQNPPAARTDKTVLVSARTVDLTAARLADWIDVIPAQYQIREQLAQAPDSVTKNILQSIVDQEVLNAQAEKEGIKPDTTEVAEIRKSFSNMVQYAMNGLRVDPKSLADSAKSTGEREKLAATRVEAAIDNLFKTGGQNMVEIPAQLASILRKKYSSRINATGFDKVIERANAVRGASDSARAKSPQPPMPMPVQPPPTGGTGRGGVEPEKKPPTKKN